MLINLLKSSRAFLLKVPANPKKNALRPHRQRAWVIPPDEDEAFVAAMETVLEVYQRPEVPGFPVIAMDERPVQLLKDIRRGLPAKPGRLARRDYEYSRNGTACAFMFTAPFQGWRRVSVRQRRTAVDWAEEVKYLLDEVYPDAVRVTLAAITSIRINSRLPAFPPAEARRLCSRLELVPRCMAVG